MNPFIFQFKESPKSVLLDDTLVEYDASRNLSIYKKTGQPAIESMAMGTDTFTKSQGEATDADPTGLKFALDTETMTFVNNESSDSDKEKQSLLMLLHTSTMTRSVKESSDHDR